MPWYSSAFLSAFFGSITSVLSKRGALKVNLLSAVWAQRFFSIFIILPFVLLYKSPFPFNKTFWLALAATCSLNTITSVLFVRAIKDSPLSLTIPIISFTPVFLLITSPLIVKEYPTLFGVIGVLLIVIGFYILNVNKQKYGFFEPIKALCKQRGSRLMFIVALIWSITSNLDKIAVQNSNPLIFSLLSTIALTLSLSIVLKIKKVSISEVLRNSKVLAPIGVANGLSNIFQMIAISLTLVPYVISIQRTGAIFGVVWGYFFFKEKNIKERLIGAIIMVLGAIIITLG